ncbi:MAG: TIM barrel protein [archaeon]|nr:TIM barrel protein [archaeon]
MARDYTIENVYEPGYKNFSPSEDSPYLGKQGLIPAKQLGLTTDPRVANQIAALSQSLNQGISVMEIGSLSPQVFETIPKQHFAEMRRKAKLAEAELTLHAPIQGTDPSGFGQRGWEESNRLLVERQLKDVIDKAVILDEKGNMPITVHGSNTYGSNFKYVKDEDGNRKKVTEVLMAVNKETGEIVPLKESVQYDPEGGNLEKGDKLSPEESLVSHNLTQWRKDVDKILFEKENADRILSEVYPVAGGYYHELQMKKKKFSDFSPAQKEQLLSLQTANSHIHQAELLVHGLFDKAYQYGGKTKEEKEEIKNRLKEFSKNYQKNLYGGYSLEELENLKDENKRMEAISHRNNLQNQSYAIQALAEDLRSLKKYNIGMLQDLESFSINKASDTFSNVAMYAYEQKKDKAPALSIENLYQEMGFSQGEDLKNLVVASREKLADKLSKEKGLSKGDAEKVAAKLIGVTFDVGHMNMSKKFGYTDEDLVKEAEIVKKFVNKVHLTDNFGFNDSHLPPGMGNVPFRALLEALGEEGAKAIKINEVGGWFEHFKSSPFPQMLEAYGSPVYSSGIGPYWSQAAGFQQSYMEGYGQILPSTNYQMFGAGFSQLPQSLGGQQGQGREGGGRMGGGGF